MIWADAVTGVVVMSRLEQMHDIVANDPSVPDEHLYGRAGYLAAVMFVQSHLGEDVVRAQTIQKVHL